MSSEKKKKITIIERESPEPVNDNQSSQTEYEEEMDESNNEDES